MTEQELKSYLISFVQEFCSKRNEAENYVNEQSDAQNKARPNFDNSEENFAWLQANPQIDWFDEFRKLLEPIYDTYVTDKKRVYGGPSGNSFGFPLQFSGIENPLETSVELKNKNRAEVYIKTEYVFGNDEYLFIMLCKANEWKIDSYKGRMYGDEKWDNRIL